MLPGMYWLSPLDTHSVQVLVPLVGMTDQNRFHAKMMTNLALQGDQSPVSFEFPDFSPIFPDFFPDPRWILAHSNMAFNNKLY